MTLIDQVVKAYPDLRFVADNAYYWSPADTTVHYNEERLDSETGLWSLLHEVAHGVLGHTTYGTDYQLLAYEVEAWEKAIELGKIMSLSISNDHVEECLDSYREWLYARSTCPTCRLNSLQTEVNTYRCLNCDCVWRVSPSRFCRPYRTKSKTPSEAIPQMVFAEKSV